MSYRVRVLATCLLTSALLAVIGSVFWLHDWRYAHPTPMPRGMTQPPLNTPLGLPSAVEQIVRRAPGRPALLHFFNPDCSCSQFNLDHARALVAQFGARVTFIAVVVGDGERSDEELRADFRRARLPMEAVVDRGALARLCGVYATPQAVVLDAAGRIYFRGNYNSSQYCTEGRTEFARLALESVLAARPVPAFPAAATTAYGCAVPFGPETFAPSEERAVRLFTP